MKTLLLVGLTLSFLGDAIGAEEKPQDKFQTAEKFEKQISQTLRLDYLLFLPKEYKSKPDQKWPLILFLHGAGERGSDVWRADIHGPSKYIVSHPEFPFILVTPQCPTNHPWQNDALLALLDDVEKRYNVDTNRVYLTGLSMGGYGTWSLAFAYPERFAAIAPICGGANSIDVRLAILGYAPQRAAALKELSVWAFHGGKDTVVPPEETERLMELLKAAKVGEIKYTLYPDATHNSWSETYNNPELYDWFLKHKRK